MYDYETNFHLTMNEDRISKFLNSLRGVSKYLNEIPGEIVECGVFKGSMLFVRFAMLRKLMGGNHSQGD